MSTPTDLPLDELRALQARAYGRDADIHSDPAALARLHELEAMASAARAGSTAPAADAAPVLEAATRVETAAGDAPADIGAADGASRAGAPRAAVRQPPLPGEDGAGTDAAAGAHRATTASAEPAPGSDPPAPMAGAATPPGAVAGAGMRRGVSEAADADAGPAATDPGGDDAPTSDMSADAPVRPWWRRIPVLWAASVVAALLIGAGLSTWIQNIEEGGVAVLSEDAEAEWPDESFGVRPSGGRVFDDFHGLRVLSLRQSVVPGSSQTCLYILTPPDGFGAGSCAAGSYPASASLEVVQSSPDELRERFPLGTSLQFVLEGPNVRVYAREPSIVEPTP
jgi:hypothetical protein